MSTITPLSHNNRFAGVRVSWSHDVAHDIRTPLTVILGYLEMLMEHRDLLQNGKYNAILEAMWRNAHDLHQTLERLLAMDEISAVKLTHLEPVDLEGLLAEHLPSWQKRVEGEGLAFHAIVIPPIPYILGDGGLIRQAVEALIENAIALCLPLRPDPEDWTTPRPQIRLYAWYGPGRFRHHVQIAVIDEGEGLSDEDLVRLCDLESEEMPAQKHLALCKAVVRAHNGRIWAQRRQGNGKRGHVILLGLPVPLRARNSENGQ